ncbi:MAG: hypothetical protein JSR46_02705, partial [Verrucomicrobia bacterium]|nr:hypothetical protein [Verrucomicrobiota bacterium]
MKLSHAFTAMLLCAQSFMPQAHSEGNCHYHAQALPGSWQQLIAPPPSPTWTPNAPLLLTDGSLLINNIGAPDTWKLTPDRYGSYINGTWLQVASLPIIDGIQYAPSFYGSAVLPDGRVIYVGGEYNQGEDALTNMGAIYDPVLDVWTPVSPPVVNGTPLAAIGDAPSVVLDNGTFMFGSIFPLATPISSGPTTFLLNPKTLTWTASGFGKYDSCDEEGFTLLPNGKVLTVTTNVNRNGAPPNPTLAQLYNPRTGSWAGDSSTVNPLSDYGYTYEIGPQVLRPNGTVFTPG